MSQYSFSSDGTIIENVRNSYSSLGQRLLQSMNEETVRRINEYVEQKPDPQEVVDLLCVGSGIKRGAMIMDYRYPEFENIVESFGLNYKAEYGEDMDVMHYSLSTHPERLFLIRESYPNNDARRFAGGLFCGYDQDSVAAACGGDGELLQQDELMSLCETEFETFLLKDPVDEAGSHDGFEALLDPIGRYGEYTPCRSSFTQYLKRVYLRYELAMSYNDLFEFDFSEFPGEPESAYFDTEDVELPQDSDQLLSE